MEEIITKKLEKIGIHGILAYSYGVYFVAFILGFAFHYIFSADYFGGVELNSWGMVLLMAGTLLILWAQNTSKSTHKVREENKDKNISHHFKKGPYSIFRSPTHIGLLALLVGFGLTINSISTVVFSIIAFIVTKTLLVSKQELLLEKKYGESYKEYKKSVKF